MMVGRAALSEAAADPCGCEGTEAAAEARDATAASDVMCCNAMPKILL